MVDGPTLESFLQVYGLYLLVGGTAAAMGFVIGNALGYWRGFNDPAGHQDWSQAAELIYTKEDKAVDYDKLPIFESGLISNARQPELQSQLEVTVSGLVISGDDLSCTIKDKSGEAFFYMTLEGTQYQEKGIALALFKAAELNGTPMILGVIYDNTQPLFLGEYILFNNGTRPLYFKTSELL